MIAANLKLWLVGKNGMLAEALQRLCPPGWICLATGREVDIANLSQVIGFAKRHRPQVIINAAAYTAVDTAEDCRATVLQVNTLGAWHLASAAKAINAASLLVSTDYVFSGQQTQPYQEDDTLAPLNCYGYSKAAGELFFRSMLAGHLPWWIVRTSWLFGQGGRGNFVRTMLKLFQEKPQLAVVNDQYGKPSFCDDVALTIYALVAQQAVSGVYHVANAGVASWYTVASEIFAKLTLAKVTMVTTMIKAIATTDFPTKAKRPAYSALNTAKINRILATPLQPWQQALSCYLASLLPEVQACVG